MLLIAEGRHELGDNNRIGQGARFFDDAPKTTRIEEFYEWKIKQKSENKK